MHTHRRQSAIMIANNQIAAQRRGTTGWDKHPHHAGLSCFKHLRAVDVVNTYNATVRGHAIKRLLCPRRNHVSIHHADLGLARSRWRMQCADMKYMSIALAQHLVYYHGDAVEKPYMGQRRAWNGNALQHMVGGVVMVKGNFWAGCGPGHGLTLFPCKVLDIQKEHLWPDGIRTRAYRLIVVKHRTSVEHAPGEMPFWMRSDAFASYIESGLRMNDAQANRVLRHLQPVAPKGRTHIQAFQHLAIQTPWNQACVVVRAHPFKDFKFHGHMHRPFVMILSDTYSENTSVFDFQACREDVEVGMVVVFFKVRRMNFTLLPPGVVL